MKKIIKIIIILIITGIILFTLGIFQKATSQIVSTEGDIGKDFKRELNFAIKNSLGTSEDFVSYSGGINIKEQIDSNLVYLLSSGEHFESDNTTLNNWYVQLRYNHVGYEFIYPELFVQMSVSESQNIKLRTLAGVGSRYNLGDYLCFGTSFMYENIRMIDTIDHEFIRMNFYIRYTRDFKDFKINNIGYYQPNLMKLDDANISYIARFSYKIKDNFFIFVSGSLAYSKYPYSPSIKQTIISTNSGISISF